MLALRALSRTLAVFALITLVTGAAAQADTIERTFDVRPGGRFVLDTDLGSVKVSSSTDDKVRVRVEREARSGADDAFEVRFDQRGDEIIVEGERPEGKWLSWNSWSRFKVSFEIEVPREFNLDLETAGGSISIDDLDGDIDCKTSGGSISIDDVGGRVDCRTSGGSITVGAVEGSVMAKTSGGSITIDRSGGSVVAKTSGGSVTVNEVMGSIEASTSGGSVKARLSSQPAGDCRLTTSGGRVDVSLAAPIAINLDAKTSGGRVHVDMPVTIEGGVSRTSVRGTVNGGGPELYLRTSGGSIYVREL